MKNASVLLQTALLIIAISLLFFYVRPAFAVLGEQQDKVSEYDEAILQASEVNNLLRSLINQIDSIATSDREALEAYLPATIDPISVQRDIKNYVDRRSLSLLSMSQSAPAEFDENGFLQQMSFNLSVTGDYESVKNLLRDTERNPYPLHLSDLSLTPINQGSGEIQADITFITYQFISNI